MVARIRDGEERGGETKLGIYPVSFFVRMAAKASKRFFRCYDSLSTLFETLAYIPSLLRTMSRRSPSHRLHIHVVLTESVLAVQDYDYLPKQCYFHDKQSQKPTRASTRKLMIRDVCVCICRFLTLQILSMGFMYVV